MAVKIPSFKLLSTTGTKSRIFLVILALAAASVAIYFVIQYFGGFGSQTNVSRVAEAPQNLKSVPGGQLSPEYYHALQQANIQTSKQAQMTGGSAVPTLINVPQQNTFQPQQNCTVMCPEPKKITIYDDIRQLTKSAKLTQQDANLLAKLTKDGVSVTEYAAELDALVKAGKLTPAQARDLLEKYKKQHQTDLLQQSATSMDNLIKSGNLSLSDANALLALEKSGATSSMLSAELNRLVKEGKLSPQAAEKSFVSVYGATIRRIDERMSFSIAGICQTGWYHSGCRQRTQ